MKRLVPPECMMRPAQIQDVRTIAAFEHRWETELAPRRAQHWRNFAIIALLVLGLIIGFKDVTLLLWVLLGAAPLGLIFGWIYWMNQHPPKKDWADYWLIACSGKVQACAKWQHYGDYTELQQLYVKPQWRSKCLGASLVERCLHQAQQPVYVISDRRHGRYFARFGFIPIAWDDLPSNFPLIDFPANAEIAAAGLARSRDHYIPMVRQFNPRYMLPRQRPAQKQKPISTTNWPGIPAKVDDRSAIE